MPEMQQMQRQMMENKTKQGKGQEKKGVECVWGGARDLPRLAEWSTSTGRIDFNDWLNLIEPQVSDHTTRSFPFVAGLQSAFSPSRGDT